MQTETIKKIAVAVESVESSLDSFLLSDQGGSTFGHENEYSAQTLKAGIEAILGDIKVLLKVPDEFVRLSNYAERTEICTKLNELHGCLTQPDYPQVAIILDALKIIMRSYSVRGSNESQESVIENVNKLIGMQSKLKEWLNEIERTKSKADTALKNAQATAEKTGALIARVDEVNKKSEEAENANNKIAEHNQNIESISANITSKEEIINSFAERVAGLQNQIDAQQKSTKDYSNKLNEYAEEQTEKLKEAELLIEQARNALGYKTAEGISAAFDERYNADKGQRAWWWVVGAAAFCAVAIYFGVQLFDIENISMSLVVSRIAVMSAAISGAWFCAAQYVKHKNTMEDYGYKAVLSKSMMAFLEQLGGDERERYLELVLTEIHKDPLRKRHDVHDGMGQGAIHELETLLKKYFKKSLVDPGKLDE